MKNAAHVPRGVCVLLGIESNAENRRLHFGFCEFGKALFAYEGDFYGEGVVYRLLYLSADFSRNFLRLDVAYGVGETTTRSSRPACKTYAPATPSNSSAMLSSVLIRRI